MAVLASFGRFDVVFVAYAPFASDRNNDRNNVKEDGLMVRAGEVEHGERIAENAESVWNWSSPAGRVRATRRAALIARAAELTSGMHVLELGCGTGLFTERFAASGAKVHAIDISNDLLTQARERSLGDDVVFALDDAENLSFADDSFDAVVGSSVLHHLDLECALHEAVRVLTPGGRMAFAEPNMANPQIALQRSVPAFRRWAGESPEETAFFRWRLARRLRRSGFVDIRIQPFDFLHPFVPESLIPVVRGIGRVVEQLPLVREIAGSLLISARRGEEGAKFSEDHERSVRDMPAPRS